MVDLLKEVTAGDSELTGSNVYLKAKKLNISSMADVVGTDRV